MQFTSTSIFATFAARKQPFAMLENLLAPAFLRPKVTEEDYKRLPMILQGVEAAARLSYMPTYVVDLNTRQFLYVSENPLALTGGKHDDSDLGSCQFYANHITHECLEFLMEVSQISYQFLAAQPPEDRCLFTLSYNLNLRATNADQPALIYHQCTPLALDREGNVWLSSRTFALPHTDRIHEAYLRKAGSAQRWYYNRQLRCIEPCAPLALDEKEVAVIRLASRGLSVEDTARLMHKSVDSVKKYRNSLYEKLGVSSMTEAIAYAQCHHLL